MPSRDEIIEMVAQNMYSGRIINNAHRGDIVEMMVYSALGNDWKPVGLGWNPWDLQRGNGVERVRIQVKQCAALQLWGPTKNPTLSFGWKKNAPTYFERNNPGEKIEQEGWFCEIFVFGLHRQIDKNIADQVDPNQWEFLVIPTSELKYRQNSMSLTKALKIWEPIPWDKISESVGITIKNIELKDNGRLVDNCNGTS